MTHKAPRREKSSGSSQILISGKNDCGMSPQSALTHCLAGEELVKIRSASSCSLVLRLNCKPAQSQAQQEGFLGIRDVSSEESPAAHLKAQSWWEKKHL